MKHDLDFKNNRPEAGREGEAGGAGGRWRALQLSRGGGKEERGGTGERESHRESGRARGESGQSVSGRERGTAESAAPSGFFRAGAARRRRGPRVAVAAAAAAAGRAVWGAVGLRTGQNGLGQGHALCGIRGETAARGPIGTPLPRGRHTHTHTLRHPGARLAGREPSLRAPRPASREMVAEGEGEGTSECTRAANRGRRPGISPRRAAHTQRREEERAEAARAARKTGECARAAGSEG